MGGQREADLGRKNQRTIAFTDEGEDMMSEARALFKDLDDRLFAGWTPEKVDAVFDSCKARLRTRQRCAQPLYFTDEIKMIMRITHMTQPLRRSMSLN